MTIGERDKALSTRIWPRSMRLAISTSAFAREQGDRSHFAQIHANGIVGFFEGAGVRSSSTSLALFRPLQISYRARRKEFGAFQHIDALRADGSEQVVQIFGLTTSCGMRFVHLVRRSGIPFPYGIDQLF